MLCCVEMCRTIVIIVRWMVENHFPDGNTVKIHFFLAESRYPPPDARPHTYE